MRVSIGPLADLPDDRCVAVAGERAVAVRSGDTAVVFPNRCLHQDTPLADGWVRDGVLTCPAHFWRYEVATGCVVGTSSGLDALPVEVLDGEVWVEVAEPVTPRAMREQLLDHARTWDRGG